jgi:Putative zinc-finger
MNMDWNCTQTEERLSDYLDGAIAPEEAAAFSAHAAGCASCAKLVAEVGGLVSLMQSAPQVVEPPQLQRRILDATLGPRKQKAASQGLFGWLPMIWQPRFAMGIVTVAASVVIVFHAAASDGGKANLNPVNLLRGANRQIHLTYARGEKFVNNLRVVYEIQSRLSSQPESMSEPVVPPPSRPTAEPQPGQQQQPANDPREKSQTIPHTSRRGPRSGPELADVIAMPERNDSSLHPAPRSLL